MKKFKSGVEIFKKMLDTLPNSIYLKDTQGRYLWLNKAAIQQLEYKHLIPCSIIGKTDLEVFPELNAAEYIKNDRKVLEENIGISKEEIVVLPNGQKLTQLSFKEPLYGENSSRPIGVLGYTVDITEMKKKEDELREEKAEAANKANKAKTEFLENMRHDIRSPLMGIIGFADIIKSEVNDPKIKEYADNLVASSYSLLGLLNEILETIKVSSGEIPLLKKKFDLKNKLNEIISLNQAQASRKRIPLLFEYDLAIPPYLIGDPTRIHRVVLELVTNALNFTHKGHVKLLVQLAKDNEKDVVLKIIVEDTGIGIPAEKQQDIYVQFKRLTPSYEGIYKGHGLGLSIAKQFIDDVEGEIYVESQIGIGTKFTFIVQLKKPLLDEELGSEDLLSVANASKAPPLKKLKNFQQLTSANGKTPTYKSHILVVEDSPMAAYVVTAMLSTLDCEVDLAEKGKLAVQLAEDKQYDLIFMDIGLPDIDGYETTKRIRLNELKKAHVPIIALTAHAGEENKKYCIDIGMNAVLTKPLVKEKAEDILNSFIPYRRERLNLNEAQDSIAKITNYKELEIFDFELLIKQFRGEKVAIEMVTLFLEGLPQELQELQAAYVKKDWSLIQRLAHKLQGGVSYCGAMRLREACAQLENAIRHGESELFENFYSQLLKETTLTEKTMREKLHRGPNQ